jgi:hypothetical protein
MSVRCGQIVLKLFTLSSMDNFRNLLVISEIDHDLPFLYARRSLRLVDMRLSLGSRASIISASQVKVQPELRVLRNLDTVAGLLLLATSPRILGIGSSSRISPRRTLIGSTAAITISFFPTSAYRICTARARGRRKCSSGSWGSWEAQVVMVG